MCVNTWKVMLPHGDRTILSLESASSFSLGTGLGTCARCLGRTSSPNYITLKMEAACFSEILVFPYSCMWCENPEH